MATLIGISGSLRSGSLNTALLRAAAQSMPAGSTLEIATIKGIPLYNGDLEATEGIPPAVNTLKDLIASADGLLLVTPEYNHGIPGVLKNAIDWLSRPSTDISRVFGNRPVAIIGASTGGFGTILAQEAWLPVLKRLGTIPWFGSSLMVSRADTLFDTTGELTDHKTRTQLEQFMAGFVSFTESCSKGH